MLGYRKKFCGGSQDVTTPWLPPTTPDFPTRKSCKKLAPCTCKLACKFVEAGTTNLPKFEPKLWNKQTFSAENVHLCRKWLFRTKVHLRPKFWLQPNFGFFKAISYGYGLSEKIIFRSHTSYGHHTRQCWWLRWWWRWLGNGNRNSNPARRHYIIWGSHWHDSWTMRGRCSAQRWIFQGDGSL